MYKPNPQDPRFGSEVRRLETPEHRRAGRRSGRWAGMVGMVMGAAIFYFGLKAVWAHEWVTASRNFPSLPGEVVCVIAGLLFAASAWMLWRQFTNDE